MVKDMVVDLNGSVTILSKHEDEDWMGPHQVSDQVCGLSSSEESFKCN
jgi:hypothetical protein